MTVPMTELVEAGLLKGYVDPHLSEAEREWLRNSEDGDLRRGVDLSEAAADLVLSTSGLIR